jgi:signal transduction histidine kinase
MLNPAGRRLLGLPDADWEGPLRDVLAGAAPLADVVAECLSTGTPIVRRTLTLGEGAAAPHLGVTVSPIGDHEGARSHGAICLFTDLSKIVDLEEQLRLKDSLARVGELTAGIAHEFRNGLATIHGYARLLDLERLPGDFRPYVSGIREETEALSQVVTNFLNFARPAELTMSAVSMADVIDRAVDDVRADVATRRGHIVIRGDFGAVMGDEVMLRQAFSNLCRNALEACLDAGVVPRIVVDGAVDRRAGVIRISVSDNGPGVPPHVAARMFRPFFTTKARGTGLGLALVQKIIVTHNGRVGLDSSHPGAQIIVTLPFIQQHEPHAISATSPG